MANLDWIREYAIQCHGSQKYRDKPYIYHLDQVFEIAQKYNATDLLLGAAYLHDVLEDTATTQDTLVRAVGIDIAHLVWCVTNEPGKNRAERNKKTYPKIHKRLDAIQLKIFDRIANLQHGVDVKSLSMLKMYTKEYADFYHEFVGWAADWEEWWELETLYKTAFRMVEKL